MRDVIESGKAKVCLGQEESARGVDRGGRISK
jgi:hypothetical protein